jgi:hypothetical protein
MVLVIVKGVVHGALLWKQTRFSLVFPSAEGSAREVRALLSAHAEGSGDAKLSRLVFEPCLRASLGPSSRTTAALHSGACTDECSLFAEGVRRDSTSFDGDW